MSMICFMMPNASESTFHAVKDFIDVVSSRVSRAPTDQPNLRSSRRTNVFLLRRLGQVYLAVPKRHPDKAEVRIYEPEPP